MADSSNVSSHRKVAKIRGKNTPYPEEPSRNVFFNKYCAFENRENLCWLNSCLPLLFNNSTLLKILTTVKVPCTVAEIIYLCREGLEKFNAYEKITPSLMAKTRKRFSLAQNEALAYLKPFMKFKRGSEESAFCCLFNLLKEERVARVFKTSVSFQTFCNNCHNVRIVNRETTIITLNKISEFTAEKQSALCICCKCQTSDQETEIVFKTLPPCLIFHFEKGAGRGELNLNYIKINSRIYHLTGVITYYLKHFVTWIRNPYSNEWLMLNDLGADISTFSKAIPIIDLRDVYVLSYEALDMKGLVFNHTVSSHFNYDDNSCSGIPVIDVSD